MAERRAKRGILGFVVLLLAAAGAFLIWRFYFARPEQPANIVVVSGRIEGDDSAVAAKSGGRVLEVRAREGDAVQEGDILATLDDQQIRAREEQARAAVFTAETRVHTLGDSIAVLHEQIRQIELQKEQSKIEAQGRVRQAEAELAAAEAQLAQQEAANQQAQYDREAYTRLARSGAVSERQGKQAVTAADQAAAAVVASKRRVEAARAAVTAVQAALVNPDIRQSQAAAIQKQITQQQSEVTGARSQVEQAKAQLAEMQAARQDLIVKAPFAGTVMTRSAEPGEVVAPGAPIVTLLDLSQVYLRGFVPEGEIGKVKVHQPARVYLDSNPSQPIEAYVSRIDPQATFTPENTYFRDERVKQVVGIKLRLKGATGFAKPGMPADGEILVQGETWPASRGRQ